MRALEILVKIIIILWALNLLRCYFTGERMWAPYYTLENTPQESVWRAFYAVVTLGVLGATCYWIVKDFLAKG